MQHSPMNLFPRKWNRRQTGITQEPCDSTTFHEVRVVYEDLEPQASHRSHEGDGGRGFPPGGVILVLRYIHLSLVSRGGGIW